MGEPGKFNPRRREGPSSKGIPNEGKFNGPLFPFLNGGFKTLKPFFGVFGWFRRLMEKNWFL